MWVRLAHLYDPGKRDSGEVLYRRPPVQDPAFRSFLAQLIGVTLAHLRYFGMRGLANVMWAMSNADWHLEDHEPAVGLLVHGWSAAVHERLGELRAADVSNIATAIGRLDGLWQPQFVVAFYRSVLRRNDLLADIDATTLNNLLFGISRAHHRGLTCVNGAIRKRLVHCVRGLLLRRDSPDSRLQPWRAAQLLYNCHKLDLWLGPAGYAVLMPLVSQTYTQEPCPLDRWSLGNLTGFVAAHLRAREKRPDMRPLYLYVERRSGEATTSQLAMLSHAFGEMRCLPRPVFWGQVFSRYLHPPGSELLLPLPHPPRLARSLGLERAGAPHAAAPRPRPHSAQQPRVAAEEEEQIQQQQRRRRSDEAGEAQVQAAQQHLDEAAEAHPRLRPCTAQQPERAEVAEARQQQLRQQAQAQLSDAAAVAQPPGAQGSSRLQLSGAHQQQALAAGKAAELPQQQPLQAQEQQGMQGDGRGTHQALGCAPVPLLRRRREQPACAQRHPPPPPPLTTLPWQQPQPPGGLAEATGPMPQLLQGSDVQLQPHAHSAGDPSQDTQLLGPYARTAPGEPHTLHPPAGQDGLCHAPSNSSFRSPPPPHLQATDLELSHTQCQPHTQAEHPCGHQPSPPAYSAAQPDQPAREQPPTPRLIPQRDRIVPKHMPRSAADDRDDPRVLHFVCWQAAKAGILPPRAFLRFYIDRVPDWLEWHASDRQVAQAVDTLRLLRWVPRRDVRDALRRALARRAPSSPLPLRELLRWLDGLR